MNHRERVEAAVSFREPDRIPIDMWSTALVFNRGHRIAVHVTSSNSRKYEVHPNSYEPVDTFDGAPVAHNTVHLSAEYASRVILPVVVGD